MPPTLKKLIYRHPDHERSADLWNLLSALTEAGESVTDAIKRQLLCNPDNRPEEVIKERVKIATFTPKITPIINKFTAELFHKPSLPVGSKDAFWNNIFFKYGAVLNCQDDDGRSSFVSFLRKAMYDALTTGKAIALVDTKPASGAVSKAQQIELGELDPYVILFPRSAMWDWKTDSNGFVFCKIHQFKLVQDTWDADVKPQHCFTIWQRLADGVITASRYVVNRKPPKDSKDKTVAPKPFLHLNLPNDEIEILAELENQPIYSVGGRYSFPIVTLTLPKNLHLAGQLLEPQKAYFRQTAGIDYSLYTSNFAMPVITGVDDESVMQGKKMGDGYYLELPSGCDIKFLERANTAATIALQYRNEIKRDIYDTLQQIAMSAVDGASIAARSGRSKQEDRRPEELLLETFGGLVKDFVLSVMKPASIAHGELVEWQISGYDNFVGSSLLKEIEEQLGIQEVDIPSPTFKRAVKKRFVKSVSRACDFSGEDVGKMFEEIDAVPDEELENTAPEDDKEDRARREDVKQVRRRYINIPGF